MSVPNHDDLLVDRVDDGLDEEIDGMAADFAMRWKEVSGCIGQEHVVEWCKLGYGFVQQEADQTTIGSLESLLDWVKVCVINKFEVELHMLDR